jgi:hypothetical protein
LGQGELGHFTLTGWSGFAVYSTHRLPDTSSALSESLAVGKSPSGGRTENRAAIAGEPDDPSLRRPVVVQPKPSYPVAPRAPAAPDATARAADAPSPKVTSADVLEALHRATGMPLVSDYYTRLYKPETVTPRKQSLARALDALGDAMETRWSRDRGWLQFRSTRFYDDRVKEVPNRLLSRWAASRQRHGTLTLDDLCEIAQLSDAQLDATSMAEGAKECWGLVEWDLPRGNLRESMRFLARCTPEQRQEAMSDRGLLFTRMSLAQQQRFIALAIDPEDTPIEAAEELADATLRVEYTQPGWFTWRVPGLESFPGRDWLQWVIPLEPGFGGRRVVRPQVRERTREAAIDAARRLAPTLSDRVVQALRRFDPRGEVIPMVPNASQIVPTSLELTIIYFPGNSNKRPIVWLTPSSSYANGTIIEE